MFAMRKVAALIMLFICTFSDIKNRTVNIFVICAFFILGLIFKPDSLSGVIPGVFLLILSKIVKGFGDGDAYLIIALSVFMSLNDILTVVFIAFILSGIWAGIMIIVRKAGRDEALPFVPFITLGYIICTVSNLYTKGAC